MFSNRNVRWAIVVAFMITLLAAPKPALALSANGSGYQDGNNCYGYQDGSNCYGSQDGNNCYGYQDGSNCYGNQYGNNCYDYQDGSNCYGYQNDGNCNGCQGGGAYNGCQYGANCFGNQYGGNMYASYGAPNAPTYVVQRGDTMRIIADRLGIPLGSLIAANPNIWNPNLIYAGQVICLPTSFAQPAYFAPPHNFGPPANDDCCSHPTYKKRSVNYYTVQKGDTLAFVAHEFGTTVKGLLDLNRDLKKNAPIRVGDILLLH